MTRVISSSTLAIAVLALGLQARAENITNTAGEVFQDVTVKDVRPDGISVRHSKGLAFLSFDELSPDLRSAYNYDPSAAADHRQQKMEGRRRRSLTKAAQKAIQAMEKSGLDARLEVLSVADDGFLASGHYVTEEEYEHTEYRTVSRRNRFARPGDSGVTRSRVPIKTETRTRQIKHELSDRIFVSTPNPELVDGQRVSTRIYPCGRYQYTSAIGAVCTVRSYATSAAEALRILKSAAN
ncbi:MAG: hypothetical protein HQ559_01125 [Lentisphaerae bacterium]|nr:hypothetical protein [Lentisphaerota bacterium]